MRSAEKMLHSTRFNEIQGDPTKTWQVIKSILSKTSENESIREITRMIANGTCVSFCNQPNARYLATSRKSRRYGVAFSHFEGAGTAI